MADHPLFDAFSLGALTLRNRLVMNPMTRCRADAQGVVGPLTVEYYAQRASAGLIVTEGIAPSANTFFTPGSQGYTDYPAAVA